MTFPGKEETETITYKRKKTKGRKQQLLDKFTHEELHHELSENERFCSDCHQELKELGQYCSRKDMINWHLKTAEYYMSSIYEVSRQKIVAQPILHADETPYTVLESETATTYYWTFLSGKHEEQGITFYHHGSRKGKEAVDFLEGFNGCLHCDQYSGYKQLPAVTLVGCWTHLKRNFIDAAPQRPSQKSLAQKATATCNQMFRFERSWADLSTQERQSKREAELKPLMDKFFDWCHDKQGQVLPKSKLGKAFSYSLNHKEAFKNVLLNGDLELSNNMAERSIKSVIMGRKNWLFSQSYEGAKSNAIIMSIIETAKRHNLNTEKYF